MDLGFEECILAKAVEILTAMLTTKYDTSLEFDLKCLSEMSGKNTND